jgi:pyruvate dehydrogenase E2 component (dihydrolipoamide acetyltransferase)
LAVGATEKRAVVGADDQLSIARMISLTLSCDHRAIDGAVGATYLASLKKYIEEPIMMMKHSF